MDFSHRVVCEGCSATVHLPLLETIRGMLRWRRDVHRTLAAAQEGSRAVSPASAAWRLHRRVDQWQWSATPPPARRVLLLAGALDRTTRNVLVSFQMRLRPACHDGEPDAEMAAIRAALTAP